MHLTQVVPDYAEVVSVVSPYLATPYSYGAPADESRAGMRVGCMECGVEE